MLGGPWHYVVLGSPVLGALSLLLSVVPAHSVGGLVFGVGSSSDYVGGIFVGIVQAPLFDGLVLRLWFWLLLEA